MRRITKDDSGERDGYWVDGDFVHGAAYRYIVANVRLKERRRAARIIQNRSWMSDGLKELIDEIIGKKKEAR